MINAEAKFDVKQILGEIDELEKIAIPRAAHQALNKAVFDATQRLKSEAQKRFFNTVSFTLKSFLYDKPITEGNIVKSRVYIRDEAFKGNAPSDYLRPQITGGSVWRTRFQRRLGARGFLGGSQGEYMLPGHLAVSSKNQIFRTSSRKLSSGEYTRALWGISAFEDLRLSGKYGKKNYRTAGSYVWVPKNLDSMAEWSEELSAKASMIRSLNDGMLPPPGIYQVMKTKLKQKFIMLDQVPKVGKRFNFQETAIDEVRKSFADHLKMNLKRPRSGKVSV